MSAYVCGLDVHKESTYTTILGPDGEKLAKRKMPNSEVAAADAFPGFFQLVTWSGTEYVTATEFEPGLGYWALVLEETRFQLPPT